MTNTVRRSQISESLLTVEGMPFLVVGAEIHNSSSSSIPAIHASFSRVADLGANTVLAPVSWALSEPVEGDFDFGLVDEMIATAERKGIRLILLWFGSWKNATSSYTPDWVKRDTDRFPRAHVTDRGAIEHLSPFAKSSRTADATAFSSLLAHVNRIDNSGTVIMVQVENEVGLLGDSRDRSALAQASWNAPVPTQVIDIIAAAPNTPVHQCWSAAGQRYSGSWHEVLGDTADAHEAFMAWAYASYVEEVAAAGRRMNSVPLLVNAWLDSPVELDIPDADVTLAGGVAPGVYPSGGPVSRVHDLWRALTPSIDIIAPDIYFGDFAAICRAFEAISGGRLLIPEMRVSASGVAQMFHAIGEFNAIGVSPFGVDSLVSGSSQEAVLKDAYELLRAVARRLVDRQDAPSRGFRLTDESATASLDIGGYRWDLRAGNMIAIGSPILPAYGIILETKPGSFLLAGRGFVATVSRTDGRSAGLLRVEERHPGDDSVVRVLNGDETGGGSLLQIPALGVATSPIWPIPTFSVSSGLLAVDLYSYDREV